MQIISPPRSGAMASSQIPTLYMPIASPPTPAPSPGPFPPSHHHPEQQHHLLPPFPLLPQTHPVLRKQYLLSLISACTPSELLFISVTIAPLLKRDFLFSLPPELSLHILGYIDEPRTLMRVAGVSKYWQRLVEDEWVWKRMCVWFGFDEWDGPMGCGGGRRAMSGRRDPRWRAGEGEMHDEEEVVEEEDEDEDEPLEEMEEYATFTLDPPLEWLTRRRRQALRQQQQNTKSVPADAGPRSRRHQRITNYTRSNSNGDNAWPQSRFSYRLHFKESYIIMMNWRHGGHLLRSHRYPVVTPDGGVITSLALDGEWVVVGLANSRIHVFSAKTGVLARTLIGHQLGVWGVCLVSKGGRRGEEPGPGSGRRGRRGRSPVHDLSAGVAGMGVNEEGTGFDHLVTPSLRIALGLDAEGPKHPHREGVFDEDAVEGGTERLGDDDEDPEGGDSASSSRSSAGPDRAQRSDVCCTSQGWGQPNPLVVSGGCDKTLRVWDIKSGQNIYTLHGHTSTIRCIRVLHNRPIAVSGSRDSTLRVWDVQRGRQLRVLMGHTNSVRCLDVWGNQVVSGSYDTTCRLWDVDTGECIHVLRGHYHQIYSVAFDGVRIASGGLDTTVRVWDAATGQCTALLQGHTALVCQLQLSPTILATGGSDGRVITFCLATFTVLHRIAAHDSSVTSLQFDKHFLVTGGNDGRVRLYEMETGNYIRELSEPSESVWKVAYGKETCAVMCKRAGKAVMEIWSLRPRVADEG